jgi:alanine dehydrogenase
MRKEPGERRDFLPPFVREVAPHAAQVVVEEGIGSAMRVGQDEYQGPGVVVGTHEEAYAQDVVLVVRVPNPDELALLRPGATLVSMLHFPTRPGRIAVLGRLRLDAVSLDSIVDDEGKRLVEDPEAVAWNGLDAAFGVLEHTHPRFWGPRRLPIRVTILGAGAVGRGAVEAATKCGALARFERLEDAVLPGVEVVTIGRNLTRVGAYVRDRLRVTDLLVDAAARHDAGHPLVPNTWIGLLPRHAVVCDLAVDGYEVDADRPTVRGIEGIPAGNLDRYVIETDDPLWEETIPPGVDSRNRRVVVSCYSWPGVHPRACMQRYDTQLSPLIATLLDRGGVGGLQPLRGQRDRALLRAGLRGWPGHARDRRATPVPGPLRRRAARRPARSPSRTFAQAAAKAGPAPIQQILGS